MVRLGKRLGVVQSHILKQERKPITSAGSKNRGHLSESDSSFVKHNDFKNGSRLSYWNLGYETEKNLVATEALPLSHHFQESPCHPTLTPSVCSIIFPRITMGKILRSFYKVVLGTLQQKLRKNDIIYYLQGLGYLTTNQFLWQVQGLRCIIVVTILHWDRHQKRDTYI